MKNFIITYDVLVDNQSVAPLKEDCDFDAPEFDAINREIFRNRFKSYYEKKYPNKKIKIEICGVAAYR